MVTDDSASIRVFLISGQSYVLWGLERLIETQQPAMHLAGTAQSCAEAFERIGDAAPDLVLLDVDSALEESVAAIAELKARSSAKILVLTGAHDEFLHDDAMLTGAHGVVRKESPAETILSAIEKVHAGQLWADRAAMGRIIGELSRLRSSQESDPDQARIESLTAREREIVALAAEHPGTGAKLLAPMLNLSQHTLRNHLTSIYEKLGVRNHTAMYAFAQKHGLTSDSLAPRRPLRLSSRTKNGANSERFSEMDVDAEGGQGIWAASLRRGNG
jgi:DNA-binding NarL/FixJ family response regulator